LGILPWYPKWVLILPLGLPVDPTLPYLNIVIYILKKYLKAKEELWKIKYFTIAKI